MTTSITLKVLGTCLDNRCGRQLISSGVWERADHDQRSDWLIAGFGKNGSHGFCASHAKKSNEQFRIVRDAKVALRPKVRGQEGRMVAQEYNETRKAEGIRDQRYIAGKYRGLVRQGFRDPIGEISHQLGRPVPTVQRYLRLAGVQYPARQTRAWRRMEVIEEVAFFRSMSRGIKEIAEKVGMDPENLATNLRHWKTEGYHQLDLDWLDGHLMMDQRNGWGDPKWK